MRWSRQTCAGPVDVRSNVHAQNALVLGERRLGAPGSGDGVWLRGNVLNESRHNGTPLTANATRLWRYAAGLNRGDWQGRAVGQRGAFSAELLVCRAGPRERAADPLCV